MEASLNSQRLQFEPDDSSSPVNHPPKPQAHKKKANKSFWCSCQANPKIQRIQKENLNKLDSAPQPQPIPKIQDEGKQAESHCQYVVNAVGAKALTPPSSPPLSPEKKYEQGRRLYCQAKCSNHVIEADIEKALTLLRESISEGHIEGMLYTADILKTRPNGVLEAMQIYLKLIQYQNIPPGYIDEANYLLGELHEQGVNGIEKNEAAAINYYTKANEYEKAKEALKRLAEKEEGEL